MLLDQLKTSIKSKILPQYIIDMNKCLTIANMIQPTIAVIKELASKILKDHYLYVSTIYNP